MLTAARVSVSSLCNATSTVNDTYMHCKPEPSRLRTLPHCNLNQICRDDLMHLCLAVMMEHVLGALMTDFLM